MRKHWDLLTKRIEYLMDKAGWNQADLARALDWPAQHLNAYLKGREPGLDKIVAIAKVFGISIADLFKTDEPPTPRIERTTLSDEVRLAISQEISKSLTPLMQEFTKVSDILDPIKAVDKRIADKFSPTNPLIENKPLTVNRVGIDIRAQLRTFAEKGDDDVVIAAFDVLKAGGFLEGVNKMKRSSSGKS